MKMNFICSLALIFSFTQLASVNMLFHDNHDFKAQEISLRVQVPLTDGSTEQHLVDKRAKLIDNAVKLNYPLLEGFKFMFNLSIDFKIDYCNHTVVKRAKNDAILEKCVWSNILAENVDISLFPILMTPENVKIFDFPGVSSFVRTKFLFLQPKLSLIMNVYTLPFTTGVWFACSGLVVLVIGFLYIATKWRWHKHSREDEEYSILFTKKFEAREARNADQGDKASEIPDSLLEVSFLAVGAITQQGAEREPGGLQGRTISWCMFLAFMFLYSAYAANIVALLQATSSGIHSVQDLVASPMDVGIHDSSLMQRVIPEVIGDDKSAILKKARVQNEDSVGLFRFTDKYEGVARMRSRMFAFHVESYIGYTLIEETFDEFEKCGLQEVQFLSFPADLYFAIKKNSPLFEMFKIGFIKLRETGIHHRESTLLHTPKPYCWTVDSNFNSVGLIDCYFAVALFAGGVFLSFGIFLVELFLARMHFKCLSS